MSQSAQYQPCRWYDPYPRLAFALKLLYLAPMRLREQALGELTGFLETQLGEEWAGLLGLELEPPLPNGRWYDHLYQTHTAVEVLRRSPDAVKDLSADMLLKALGR